MAVGAGLRRVAEQAGVDRKTARRYVQAAVDAGLARDGGAGQLTDELVGVVAQAAAPFQDRGVLSLDPRESRTSKGA